MIKLTKPQKLLLYIIRKNPERCSMNYRPAKRLVKLRLADWVDDRGVVFLRVTKAGLEWREGE